MSIAEPMQTQTFNLSYAKAEDIIRLLTGGSTHRVCMDAPGQAGTAGGEQAQARAAAASSFERGSYMFPSGAVTLDARTNQIFVTDYPHRFSTYPQAHYPGG